MVDMCAGVPQLSAKIGALKQTAKRAKAKGNRGRAAKRKSARAAKRAARASDKPGAASKSEEGTAALREELGGLRLMALRTRALVS